MMFMFSKNSNTQWVRRLISCYAKKRTCIETTLQSYADAVTFDPVTQKEYFTMPYEDHMAFNTFMDLMEGKQVSENANYISLQNGSLPVEYSAIENDVDKDINWCSEALGKKPDAVNFWFGDDKSATSLHKDPYENCYAVIRGQKTFILYPPTEYYCMHESVYQNAIYEPNPTTHKLELKPMDGTTPWIPVNPLHPDLAKFPRFRHACPVTVTVNEGEMLYLPGRMSMVHVEDIPTHWNDTIIALWFHQVMQKGEQGVIAINYWYDMDYSNMLYPTMALYRRLLTGIMENNRELIDNDDGSDLE